MGEVIKFDFNREKPENKNQEEKNQEEDEGKIIHVDFSKVKEKRGPKSVAKQEAVDEVRKAYFDSLLLIDKMMAPEDVDRKDWSAASLKAQKEILPFLQSLKGHISIRQYHESFCIIQNFSNRNLVEAVLDSSREKWTSKPAYYKALAEEMFLRVKDRHSRHFRRPNQYGKP